MELDRKVALITGASRGIGLAIAKRCAGAGMAVALVARDPERLAAARDSLPRDAVAMTIPVDLRDKTSARTVISLCRDSLGLPDFLVNNAGTAPSEKFENTSDEQLEEVLDLHVKASFRLLRELTPAWKSRGSGAALQVASSAGLRGYAFTAAYTAAKHAMLGLTRALAAEWEGSGLRIGAICPGFVDTDITRESARRIAARGKQSAEQALLRMGAMNRIGRLHTTDEVAEAAWRFLADPAFGKSGAIWDLDSTEPRLA